MTTCFSNTTCLAVDISLLAVLIALHATKKNKNLELVVMALLFSHLIMTTELFSKDDSDSQDSLGAVRYASTFSALQDVNNTNENNENHENHEDHENHKKQEAYQMKNLRKSVSDGEFERMTHMVPTQKTLAKGATSNPDAHVKLAKSRTSFFQQLFPQDGV